MLEKSGSVRAMEALRSHFEGVFDINSVFGYKFDEFLLFVSILGIMGILQGAWRETTIARGIYKTQEGIVGIRQNYRGNGLEAGSSSKNILVVLLFERRLLSITFNFNLSGGR